MPSSMGAKIVLMCVGLCISAIFGLADIGFGILESIAGLFIPNTIVEMFGVSREVIFEIFEIGSYAVTRIMIAAMDSEDSTSMCIAFVTIGISAFIGMLDVASDVVTMLVPFPFIGGIIDMFSSLGEIILEFLQLGVEGFGYISAFMSSSEEGGD